MLALTTFLVLLCLSTTAAADEDFDRAYRALQRGEVRPLAEILAVIEPRLDGDIVGVEFEREKGRYVYEFEVITPPGRLVEVYVDAASGRILEIEDDTDARARGRGRDEDRRGPPWRPGGRRLPGDPRR